MPITPEPVEDLKATLIRLPPSLIEAVKADAKRNERSMSASIRFLLDAALRAPGGARPGRTAHDVPSAVEDGHVCTKWRINTIGKNVCVDDACQKPKYR